MVIQLPIPMLTTKWIVVITFTPWARKSADQRETHLKHQSYISALQENLSAIIDYLIGFLLSDAKNNGV